MFRVHTTAGHEWSVTSDLPIRNGDRTVGYTTSAAFGAKSKTTIAMGFLNLLNGEPEASTNDKLTVESFGHTFQVELLSEPPCPVSGKDN
jgi:glycine cleavage system aminomethyltransferase T